MQDFKQLKRNLKKDVSAFPTIKVSLLGDTATQFLATAIRGEGIERGYNIDLFEAEYNQVERQVLDPASDLYQHDAKYTVVFQSTHKLMEHYSLMAATDWSTLADERIAFIRTICENVGGKIIYYTVWGGVVGDDGWENVQVGHGLGIGKAFSEFQQWVKKLNNRGIIVCVCSKNDEDKAKEPFERNPEMVLKLDDISVFVANWENKADNLRTIQSILNIGFDSMVFLDDNPFERNMVRENVPGVTVPELPEDPGDYLEFLYTQNLFETASYSSADKDRTKQYQVEAQRVATSKKFTNEADFLKSLEMISEVGGFTSFNTPRVAQLSQRCNQFNLCTVRYTEDQITAIENDPKQKGFAFTLEDKFGDNGLIAVVIVKELETSETLKPSETLFIDTWFMSCRVLKRGMENFTLNTLVQWAQGNGYKKIIGKYLPTPKNNMVAEHYTGLGFTKLEGTVTAQWALDVVSYQNRECYITTK